MKAYRQDFKAIARLVTDGDPSHLAVTDITRESMRTGFAGYARDHEAASIRRCWSTCSFNSAAGTFGVYDSTVCSSMVCDGKPSTPALWWNVGSKATPHRLCRTGSLTAERQYRTVRKFLEQVTI
jgi:hypothetical protein